jgi:hypothetical protein
MSYCSVFKFFIIGIILSIIMSVSTLVYFGYPVPPFAKPTTFLCSIPGEPCLRCNCSDIRPSDKSSRCLCLVSPTPDDVTPDA